VSKRPLPSRRDILALETPEKVQAWLWTLPYNRELTGETCRGLVGVLRHGTAHCLEAALATAAIMEHHGFPPLLLDIESTDHLDHVVFLFQRDGQWGSVGRSRCGGLHGRKPVFDSPADVARSYMAPFIDQTGRVKGYGVLDLRILPTRAWATRDGNLWHVHDRLVAMRHSHLPTPDADYRKWKKRFDAWWKTHGRPNHEWPLHYPKSDWMPLGRRINT
jgi:hypothetical protein